MIISYLNKGYIKVMMTNLEGTLQANSGFNTENNARPYVLQRADGTVYSGGTDLWTYDLSKARFFDRNGIDIPDTVLNQLNIARDRISHKLLEQIEDLKIRLRMNA